MSQHELVEAYRQGQIGRVTFVRRLIKSGVSAGAALALALTVPAAAKADACLECPGGPGANAVANAGAIVGNVPVNVAEHGNAPSPALGNIAVNTGNAAVQLGNVAEDIATNQPGPNNP